MAKKTEVFQVSGIDTIIGSSVRLKGNMSSEGDIALDGTLTGNIKSGGHVAVGVNARIIGSIHAVSAEIGGHVDGDVIVADSLGLTESAQLKGDVNCTRLEITLGAIFIGTSKMKPAQASELEDRAETEA